MDYISADDLYKMSWNKLDPPCIFTYNDVSYTFMTFPDVWIFFGKNFSEKTDVLNKVGEEQFKVWDKKTFETDLRTTFNGNVRDVDIQNFINRWEVNPQYSVHPGAASVVSVADGEDEADGADGADGETKQDDLLDDSDLLDDRISGNVFLKLRL